MRHSSLHHVSAIAIAITAVFATPLTVHAQGTPTEPSHQETLRPVKLLHIGKNSAHFKKVFPAKVAANQQVDLAFRINGQLTRLNLLAGQHVAQGDVLAQLDNRDAKNALLNAQANHQLATVDFARKKELLARKLISTSEFDTAKAQLQSSVSALNSAKDQLSYTTLTAPFSGVVAKVALENHQMLQASQVVMTLQSNQEFDLTFNVPESYVFNMNTHQMQANKEQYRVKFNGIDTTFIARFKEMNTVVNNGSQTYQITLSFLPPKALPILPGMSAEVVINEQQSTQPIAILPLTAIVHDAQNQQNFVWVYHASTQSLKKTNVVLGELRTEGSEVLSGLNQGDLVVAVGANAIRSEMKVTPLRWERGV